MGLTEDAAPLCEGLRLAGGEMCRARGEVRVVRGGATHAVFKRGAAASPELPLASGLQALAPREARPPPLLYSLTSTMGSS